MLSFVIRNVELCDHDMIRNVELCDHATSDILLWEGSDKGLLTLGNAYEEFRHKFPVGVKIFGIPPASPWQGCH
jgi:hypothetical protein